MTLKDVQEALRAIATQDGAKSGLTLASKLVTNILAQQDDPKYRKLKTTGTAIMKLLGIDGGLELLLALGFEPDGEALVLPTSVSSVGLLQSRDAILNALAALENPPEALGTARQATDVATTPSTSLPPAAVPAAAAPAAMVPMDVDDQYGVLTADGEDDEDLRVALALSVENDGLRYPPVASMPVSAPSPLGTDIGSQKTIHERLRSRVHELFAQMTATGLPPNEAAAQAIEQATTEMKDAATLDARPTDATDITMAHAPPAQPLDVASKDGFAARVRKLFEDHVAAGAEPNVAAAKAVQMAQSEAAASRQRRSESAVAPLVEEVQLEGTMPPVVMQQSSEAAVKFQRWEEIEKVAQAQVDVINELYRTEGITFVDPSFPPTDRSLYASTETATTWKCRGCNQRNPLPPPPTEMELIRLMTDPSTRETQITCGHCGTDHQMLEVAMRPCAWQRPSNLRDDVTLQYSTVPWVLVRGEPRPDDIR